MELINPAEISGKIMTLIDRAKSKIIIVSPYNKIYNWKKLTQRIEKAIERGVIIKWYLRKNIENNVYQIEQLGIKPIEIENLHCKLYMNENEAVVSSMNLHEYSDTSSIDIGYHIQEKEKYNELLDFISTYIDSTIDTAEKTENIEISEDLDFKSLVYKYFENKKSYYSKIDDFEKKGNITICIRNYFEHFDLFLSSHGDYFRIDLRLDLRSDYDKRDRVFNYFKSSYYSLRQGFGYDFQYGNQMKRLKIDLELFENYTIQNWKRKEFEILKPILDNVIKTSIKYLSPHIIQKL